MSQTDGDTCRTKTVILVTVPWLEKLNLCSNVFMSDDNKYGTPYLLSFDMKTFVHRYILHLYYAVLITKARVFV